MKDLRFGDLGKFSDYAKKRPNSTDPDDQAIQDLFESCDSIRTNCSICGERVIGTIDVVEAHLRGCLGPG